MSSLTTRIIESIDIKLADKKISPDTIARLMQQLFDAYYDHALSDKAIISELYELAEKLKTHAVLKPLALQCYQIISLLQPREPTVYEAIDAIENNAESKLMHYFMRPTIKVNPAIFKGNIAAAYLFALDTNDTKLFNYSFNFDPVISALYKTLHHTISTEAQEKIAAKNLMNPRVNLLHYSIARSYLFNSPLNEERAILHLSLVLNDRQTSALLAYCCKLLLQNMAEHHRNEFIRYKAATNLVQAYLNEAAKQPINFCKKIILDKAAKYLSPFNVEYDDVQTQDLKTRITSALAELHQKNDRGYIKSMLESPSHLLDIDAKLKAKDQKISDLEHQIEALKRENRQLRDAAAQANYTQAALTTAMDSPILNDNSAEREEILQDALNEQILNETLAEFSLLSKTA